MSEPTTKELLTFLAMKKNVDSASELTAGYYAAIHLRISRHEHLAAVASAAKKESLIRRAMDSAHEKDPKTWWTLHDEHVESLAVLDTALARAGAGGGT